MAQPTIADMIRAAETALSALADCRRRLETLSIGAPPRQLARILAESNNVVTEQHLYRMMLAHLKAAGTAVKPVDEGTVTLLTRLENKLSNAIVNRTILAAALDEVKVFIDAGRDLGDIIEAAT
ncbi:MAG: hypothetical protein SFV18_06895 [Bryobacteraceae bacterium]|nr:hypothetical protein [Bryobacteraceae bacterium]